VARPSDFAAVPAIGEPAWLRWALTALALALLGLLVVLPLAVVMVEAARAGLVGYWHAISTPDTVAAVKLTLLVALATVPLNMAFGIAAAWAITKFRFAGKNLLLTLIDLPFALPTAVAGIALTALYAGNGWLGQYLEPQGVKVAYAPLGIVVALLFVGLPFTVRTVQPVLEALHLEHEEAAASLGASRFTTQRRVVLPPVLPAMLTGFGLAFARGVGEYGSVIFIAGNLPYVSEIAPLLIVIKLEEFDYQGATVIAVLMLLLSFAILFAVNKLQRRLARGQAT
jgi:sulfate transport system permease protein